MTVDKIESVLLWCGFINYGFLILWVLVLKFARRPLRRIAEWYGLPVQHFDTTQYAGILLYKMGIFFFNFVPYVALRMVV